jgi:hypothetical protein
MKKRLIFRNSELFYNDINCSYSNANFGESMSASIKLWIFFMYITEDYRTVMVGV